MDPNVYVERRKRCVSLMQAARLDALLLLSPANLFYLTGDRRPFSFAVLARHGEVGLGVPLTDLEDARRMAFYDCVVGFDDQETMFHGIRYYLGLFNLHRGVLGLEYEFLSHALWQTLTGPAVWGQSLAFRDAGPLLAELRRVKDADEIASLSRAARVARAGLSRALAALRPGITEIEIAAEAEYAMRLAGAESLAPIFVLSGPRTQIAHGPATRRAIGPDDLVMIDVHPAVDGYRVDLCRTVCLGEPTAAQREAYQLYLEAQQAATAAARSGANVAAIEAAMASTLAAGGYRGHGYGELVHGVGLELQEAPRRPVVSLLEDSQPPLEPNVVLSIGNSGLYVGNWGVRVEDTLVVGEEGPQVLTDYPRSLCLEDQA